jgi:hypothetical protein
MLRSIIWDLNGVVRRPQAVITLMDVFARNLLERLGHGLHLDLSAETCAIQIKAVSTDRAKRVTMSTS